MDFGEAGILLFTGATDFEFVGRKAANLSKSEDTVWEPMRLAALAHIPVRFVSSSPCSAHMFAITDEGKDWMSFNIVMVATGKNHSLFLTDDGKIYACGENKSGQCGTSGAQQITEPKMIVYDGPPAKKVASGADFSVLLDVNGNLWTWGHPEHGQLGNNTDGSYLETAGKVSFNYISAPTKITTYIEKDPKSKKISPVIGVHIKDVSCGNNHSVAIDERNRAFSWGFGGYGRLGHSETGNELAPRLIKFLDGPRRGVSNVTCGGQFNLASSEIAGTTYMWGQYHTSKEANMYPKNIPDLSGWNVRSIACNGKGWMIAADNSVIGVGPSPCFGEMGLGERKKSSAFPVEIKTLDSLYVIKTGMGISHSLFIVRNNSEDSKKAIEEFDILDQSDMDN
ncbi:Protein RCC2 homolog,Protein RCC2 [Lepeophtheirus salmonis]|uniref:Protein RCC2 homolog,Protein RCC2 n=1 Tax=Lepeophtheirus salmonis TaxID=72036 RepID=A0A7R8HCP1_LEPSM|nr:Protein RCC2 homolog,Protein RCC2 [Lepeophtheirus salmonis]CAF3014040.1 Protein RCC2 homolog,Protein RCC2 [Lepeophtheirus salmonis]